MKAPMSPRVKEILNNTKASDELAKGIHRMKRSEAKHFGIHLNHTYVSIKRAPKYLPKAAVKRYKAA